MRKSICFIFIFLISSMLSGFAVREENPNQIEQKEIEYFQNKEYKGDKEIYTEVDLYPLYFKEGEAKTEDILRYLRLLRNEIFARSGYIFESEDLKEFFGEMEWYEPKMKEVELNEIEKENVSVIQEEEEKYKLDEVEKEEQIEGEYVKKVIIEANWGDGPGEFGIALWSSPPEGPGPLTVDEYGNIYISDLGNLVIHKYDKTGKFIKDISKGKIVLNIAIKHDTIYAIGLNNINDRQKKFFLIEEKTDKILLSSDIKIPGFFEDSYSKVKMKNEDGDIVIRKGYEKFGLTIEDENIAFKQDYLVLDDIIDQKVNNLKEGLNDYLLGYDIEGNYYFGNLTIYKISPIGSVIYDIKLPRENYIGEYKIDKTYITEVGDIYYIYPTGELIVEDWEQKFIPGKVRVIKWELKR